MKKYWIIALIVVVVIVGVFVLVKSNDKSESQGNTTNSTNENTKILGDSENIREPGNTKVYYGKDENFEEHPVIVDLSSQRKDIIKLLILEIGQYAGYEIETTGITIGNNRLTVELASDFAPSEDVANTIYDSIFKTCRAAFGVTRAYFKIEGGETIERSI